MMREIVKGIRELDKPKCIYIRFYGDKSELNLITHDDTTLVSRISKKTAEMLIASGMEYQN